MPEFFIGEPLVPVASTFDPDRMARGAPGLPGVFTWRGQTIRVAAVRREWRETGPCRHGSGEQYVRKHWFEVTDDAGRLLTIYFDRQARGRRKMERWHLFSLAYAGVAAAENETPESSRAGHR